MTSTAGGEAVRQETPAQQQPPPPEPKPSGRRARRVGHVPAWFLLPALAFYVFAVLWPSFKGAGLAFTNWDGLSGTRDFVGLEQFRRLFTDSSATGAIIHTLLIAAGVTIIQNFIGLLLALGVHTKIKSRNVLRVALFAPAIITPVATAYLWQYLLTPDGAINRVFGLLGLDFLQQNWLGDPSLALWCIVGVVVWQFAGYSMVIFLAGLQGISEEVLEASHVDGAGAIPRFWYVVRPELAPAITINLMLSIIGGLKLFDQVWVMTGGGPGTSTDTMSTLLYKNAFQFNDFAYGIAMALVLTLFVGVISGIQYSGLVRQGGSQ